MQRGLIVEGRVTSGEQRGGVHGLRVEALDACGDRCLGVDLTNADGSFRIHGSVATADDLRLVVRDRTGRVVHDTAEDGCSCGPDAPARVELVLPPEVLWWHHRQSVSWQRPPHELIPAIVMDEVREAVATFAGDRRAKLDCLVPVIARFQGIVDDAWSTLRGDVEAGSRLRDALDVICGLSACATPADSPVVQVLASILAEEWATPADPCADGCDEAPADPAPPRPVPERCTCCAGERGACPCRPALIPNDTVVVLVMAALHLSCGHEPTAVRYGGIVLDQIAAFDTLAALHRAAAAALRGDTAARRHFSDLLDTVVTCGCEGDRELRRCCPLCLDADLEGCIRDAARAWNAIGCYSVDTISPARACPGDEVVICGSGLGEDPGMVRFEAYGGHQPGPLVRPEEWCCERITVTVPEGAGCGLRVVMPVDTIDVCGRFLEYRRFGCVKAQFEGTAAAILAFGVEGVGEDDCLEPGTPLRVSWHACATDRVRVEVRDEGSGALLGGLDPAAERGAFVFGATNFTQTTRVRISVVAEGQCQPPQVERSRSVTFQARPDLSVDGIEVTQAIQYYRAAEHLSDASDRGPDNTLRLVVDKAAWVRAYLRSGQVPTFDAGLVRDVDGSLTVERRVGGVWGVVATIASQNGPVDAQDAFVSYDTERGNIDNSLNFVVPAAVMTGLLRFGVAVESPFAHCPGNRATRSVTADVNLRQTLNAAFITIGYNGPPSGGGPNLNLPAPTLAQCQAETSWAMTTYPVSGAPNVRIAGTFVTATPLDDPRSCPGCCSPNWQPLLQQVAGLVAADQLANPGGNWVYYGIVNGGIPVNVPGCNGWGATGGLAGQPATYAHEIGHQFGLPHARCGNAGAGNAAYPVYEPYDLPVDVPANPVGSTNWTMASIGEYGLDINNGNIANPATAEDFMSYCGPRWVSLFTHNFLVNAGQLAPQVIPTGSGAGSDRVIADDDPTFERPHQGIESLVTMLGRVDAEGSVEVLSVARLDTRYLVGDGVSTDWLAQLVGEDGTVVAEDRLYRYSATGERGGKEGSCCDDCAEDDGFLFKAMVLDTEPGTCLRIVHDSATVWERARPGDPPAPSRVRAAVDKGGRVRVSWSLDKGHAPVSETWLRWSDDDGATWHALAAGVEGTSADVDPELLPAGPVCFQVMAHDGFTTTVAGSGSVDIEDRPPSVAILYPKPGDRAYAERQIHLRGTAGRAGSGPFPDAAFTWYVDGDEVARGADAWIDNPGPGRHAVCLRVSGPGGTGEADTTLVVPGEGAATSPSVAR